MLMVRKLRDVKAAVEDVIVLILLDWSEGGVEGGGLLGRWF